MTCFPPSRHSADALADPDAPTHPFWEIGPTARNLNESFPALVPASITTRSNAPSHSSQGHEPGGNADAEIGQQQWRFEFEVLTPKSCLPILKFETSYDLAVFRLETTRYTTIGAHTLPDDIFTCISRNPRQLPFFGIMLPLQ